MYENRHITEPKWKSWIVQTTTPLFTPDQCKQIIECGRRQPPQKAQVGMGKPGGGTDTKKRVTTISWIPFKEMGHMYRDLNNFIQKANENHFGFGDIQVTENAQFTEYPEGGFYDWHMDCDVNMQHEPPVRKISMTLLLNDPSEFEGGDLEFDTRQYDPKEGPKFVTSPEIREQGSIVVFPSFVWHRVKPVTRGIRNSVVIWNLGEPWV